MSRTLGRSLITGSNDQQAADSAEIHDKLMMPLGLRRKDLDFDGLIAVVQTVEGFEIC